MATLLQAFNCQLVHPIVLKQRKPTGNQGVLYSEALKGEGAPQGFKPWSCSIRRLSNHINSSEMEVSIVMGVPPNGWFIMENAIKMDDLLIKPTPPD